MVSDELLEILACPVCKGDLELIKKGDKEFLRCEKCDYDYPIRDDIPILLPPELQDQK